MRDKKERDCSEKRAVSFFPFQGDYTKEAVSGEFPRLALVRNREDLELAAELDCPVLGIEGPAGEAPSGSGRDPAGKEHLDCSYVICDEEEWMEDFPEAELYAYRVWQRQMGYPWEILRTERTLVREMTGDDLPALMELYRRGNAEGFLADLLDEEEEAVYQEHYRREMYELLGYGFWLVFDRETGNLIGRAGFEPYEPEKTEEIPGCSGKGLCLEMGYLIDPDLRGRGIAAEVCRALLDYGRELGAECVVLRIRRENLPSLALAEKLGFVFCRQEGDVRYYSCRLGEAVS